MRHRNSRNHMKSYMSFHDQHSNSSTSTTQFSKKRPVVSALPAKAIPFSNQRCGRMMGFPGISSCSFPAATTEPVKVKEPMAMPILKEFLAKRWANIYKGMVRLFFIILDVPTSFCCQNSTLKSTGLLFKNQI